MTGRISRIRRIVVAVVLAAFVGAVALAAALKASEPLLVIRTPIKPADVIVVLGGDGPARAWKAAGLYRSGAAPRVLVTGTGDCQDIRHLMMNEGVPGDVIQVECASRNTWENATLSAPRLAAMGAQSGILVTSWFHTRRALACFRQVVPQMEWMSAPVERGESYRQMIGRRDGVALLAEYVKIGWYSVRYGVAAF